MSRILVAEDSPVNMALLADVLELSGHEVIEARNGKEAVDVARAEKPDIILLDMMMPVMDGFQAAQALKAAPETQGIPIVALTALAMEGDERRALEAGCDAYVSKPIDTRALPQLLDRMLGRGPAVPRAALEAMRGELREGVPAMRDALERLVQRGNDHAALRQARDWAHRLRGGAASLELEPLAAALAGIEELARRADEAGRIDEAALADVRGHLVQVYALQARLETELGGA